jgi:hypothetical protein
VVLASGQVEGVLRMNDQISFMMEDLVCVFIDGFARTTGPAEATSCKAWRPRVNVLKSKLGARLRLGVRESSLIG